MAWRPSSGFEQLRLGVEDALGADVAGHDHDRVRKIRQAATSVGQPPVVEHLQEQIEHVLVRFLDLVEQQHRVRTAAHRLRQEAALIALSGVAGRRAPISLCAMWRSITRSCRAA